MVEYYFTIYLAEVHNIDNFIFNKPTFSSSYREKCILLLIEIDSIMQQFTQIKKNNCIDHDLHYFNTESLSFENIKSLNDEKYAEYKNNSSNYYLLFNIDLSSFCLEIEGEYLSVFEAVNKGLINDELDNYNKKVVQDLIDRKYLRLVNGYVVFYDNQKVYIMYEIYHKGFIKLANKKECFIEKCKELEVEGEIEITDTLLSKDEIDYFNYNLNNKKYKGSLAIRNKYLHNGSVNSNADENTHIQNYYRILKLVIYLILKIEDDLQSNKTLKTD